jgi:hypothetical protein
MPRRLPINPVGYYHVGSRACYGRAIYPTVETHERLLQLYGRVGEKYRWRTLTWALVHNHHHFVLRLMDGGLSDGLREVHGGFSRWFHQMHGETGQGHLFRHGFFCRELETASDVLIAACYVDLNPVAAHPHLEPAEGEWSGYRATVGLDHPRAFHRPAELLRLLDDRPGVARLAYSTLVKDRHDLRRLALSPNDEDPGARG